MLISHGCLVCLHLIGMERKYFLVWFGLVWFGLVWFGLVWFTVEKVLLVLVLVKVLLFYQGLLLCSWDCVVGTVVWDYVMGLYSGTM